MQFSVFMRVQLVLIACSAVVLMMLFPVGGAIDLHLIAPWVDATGQFHHRDNWYLAKLNHVIVKNIIIGVYAVFFVLWLASFKMTRLAAQRWQYGYMFWVSMLCTSIVGILKSQSSHACPWNMTHPAAQGFVWDFSATHGHCFPGGHASTGFALMTGYFVYRATHHRRALFYLFAGLILGFAMGWAQMMRGAHFLSHNLWTGWWAWSINCLIYLWAARHLDARHQHS
ncbi:phosphatase PAP2 family protein [Acinetobacter soli]|nr:phosphatase PAP2 family protein [Acinetobacter soli]MBO3672534.1 phosphatase PAP2 family protein [Acinetobacter soli]MDS7693150.1 phosphatase PAP2 family protein [Acinetobacter soli]